MKKKILAIVNRAAGGGRSGKMAEAALDNLRKAGVDLETVNTAGPGDSWFFSNSTASSIVPEVPDI